MKIDTQHPEYTNWVNSWVKCRDCYEGQEAVKRKGETYLPKLSLQPQKDYDAYKNRALFYSITSKSVGALVGMTISKPPVVIHPPELNQYFTENSGTQFYEALWSSVSEVLLMGRYGLLVDRAEDNSKPQIVGYTTENIINWKVDRNGKPYLVVLRELVYQETDDVTHNAVFNYRVLKLESSSNVLPTLIPGSFVLPEHDLVYTVELFNADGQSTGKVVPRNTGKLMSEIPFYIVSPIGVGFQISKPPVLDIVNVNISHYQTSADLEHGRHFIGLPTVVVSGVDANTTLKIGSMQAWILPDKDAKASYLEFKGEGLKSLETALKEKENQMASLSARMIGNSANGSEAADTVRLRYMSETASLASVARSVEAVLNLCYKTISVMENIDPNLVDIKIDKEFLNNRMSPSELVKLTESYLTGGISVETYVFNMRRGEILSSSRTDEQEISDLKKAKETIEMAKAANSTVPAVNPQLVNP